MAGSLLHVFGLMMTSLGTEYYQILLAQGLCSAIGVSAIFQPCMFPCSFTLLPGRRGNQPPSAVTCVAGWFNKRRGAAFGILFTGSSIGGVVFFFFFSL